ncbi:MAG: hypothetical protein U9M94_04605 [Patescibacteria group bacterium]|nr:hypothetical protein [Patescibacteria group bacterium]
MPKLSPISGKKMIKFLKRCGFEVIRIKGRGQSGNRKLDPKNCRQMVYKLFIAGRELSFSAF